MMRTGVCTISTMEPRAGTLSRPVSTSASASNTPITIQLLSKSKGAGRSKNPNLAKSPTRASGKYALTPAIEESPIPVPAASRVSIRAIITYRSPVLAGGIAAATTSSRLRLPILERLTCLNVVRAPRLPDQDVDVLDGGTDGLVNDARYLLRERLPLLLGASFPDIPLYDRHANPPLSDRLVFGGLRFIRV